MKLCTTETTAEVHELVTAHQSKTRAYPEYTLDPSSKLNKYVIAKIM